MKKINILTTILLVLIYSCGYSTSPSQEDARTTPQTTENQPRQKVKISTYMGEMVIELYNETPLHRDNFIKLVKEGFYDNTLFHRVIMEFMIQGGDPESRNAAAGVQLGSGGPGYTVPAEFIPDFYHHKGALAAARMGDQVNPEKASSGSQFYLVQGKVFTNEELDMLQQRLGKVFTPEQRLAYTTEGGTPHLDGGYTVYGRVIEGIEVLDRIAYTQTDRATRPITDIPMTMTLIEN